MSPETKAAIVVIDGDGTAGERIAAILSRQRYRVYVAGSVTEGIGLIGDSRAELALIDCQAVDAELCTVLGEIGSRFPSTYLIVSSPRCQLKRAAQLAGELSVEWFSKPITSADLIGRLDSLLRIRELELGNRRLQLEQELLLLQLETCQQDFHQLIREKTESLQKAHSEIAQTEKLAAMGYLAAGMAHDIRNPLNSISLFTQLMRQNSIDPDQEEYLGKIIKEIERIDAIIRKLLNMSSRSRNVTSDVRIDRVIDTALEVFAPQIETGKIRLERRYELTPPPIKADAAELEQVFTNLFLNALDEMPGGGRLGVGIAVEEDMVVVRVEDSGKGIPEHALPRIFDPFFTTKPRGTGVGLPVVKRIARLCGGSVRVERSSREGTVVRLEFPVCREEALRSS
ncbi:sensor histidine kinase [Pelobacter propionicus]|nr:ATP-binding protein [Pelobacter propionicus]